MASGRWCRVHVQATLPPDRLPEIHPTPGWLPTGVVVGWGLFLFGVVRADLKALEARQQEDVKELRDKRDKVDALPSKILELLRTANDPVTLERRSAPHTSRLAGPPPCCPYQRMGPS